MSQAKHRRNLTIFGSVMRGDGLRHTGQRFGISAMRVAQLVQAELGRRGFEFSDVPGRHDIERARRQYSNGLLPRKYQRRMPRGETPTE